MPVQVPNTQERGRFVASFRRLRTEELSASGGLRPPNPHKGVCPMDPAGGYAPRPPLQAQRIAMWLGLNHVVQFQSNPATVRGSQR